MRRKQNLLGMINQLVIDQRAKPDRVRSKVQSRNQFYVSDYQTYDSDYLAAFALHRSSPPKPTPHHQCLIRDAASLQRSCCDAPSKQRWCSDAATMLRRRGAEAIARATAVTGDGGGVGDAAST